MDLSARFRRSLGTGCAPLVTSAPACAARSGDRPPISRRSSASHWPRAYRAAYLVTHDAAAAEDIAQESFLAAIRALDRFDRRRPFGPWLHRIVVNRAIDWTRARQLRAEVELAESLPAPEPDAPPRDDVLAALARLAARAPGGDRAAPPARVHAGRDRRGARAPARHRQLAPAPRPRRAGGRAVRARARAGRDPRRGRRARARVGRAREAFAEREPAPPQSHWPRVAAVALALAALVAAALSPPGRAVLDEIREVVGVERAQPALFSLPADRAGCSSPRTPASGSCKQDGSKRLLGEYREASWSPFGRFVVAARANELAALEPDGDVRWTLARPGVPLAALDGDRDGHADRLRRPHGHPRRRGRRHRRPAARPPAAAGPARVAAGTRLRARASRPRGEVRVVDVDTGTVALAGTRGRRARHDGLEWSSDGRRLLVLSPSRLRVYDERGRDGRTRSDPAARSAGRPSRVPPGIATERAPLRVARAQSTAVHAGNGAPLFNGTGDLRRGRVVAGRPLAARRRGRPPTSGSSSAPTGRRIRAVANVSEQFRSRTFPRVEGWCCAP